MVLWWGVTKIGLGVDAFAHLQVSTESNLGFFVRLGAVLVCGLGVGLFIFKVVHDPRLL